MKRILLPAIFSLLPLLGHAQPETLNVLFVGNSLTYFYGMPTTVSQMANAAGDKVAVSQHTVGNTGFYHHMNNPDLYNMIRSKKWDYVIMQPGSYETYGDPSASVVNSYFQKMRDSIYKYSPCAQVMLYEISNSSLGFSSSARQEYINTQSQFLRNIQKLSDLAEVPFIPAGEVLRYLHLERNMMLWESPGDIHPNPYGAYAIACAMYNAIFKKRVSGMSLEPLRWARDLDPEVCALIQHVSDSILLDTPREIWRAGKYQPYAHFSVLPFEGDYVHLYNYSLNYDRLEWVFADGTTSSEDHPIKKMFTDSDKEWVVLKAYKGDCYNIFARTVDKNADATSVPQVHSDEIAISIFPNPAHDQLTVRFSGTSPARVANLQLFDMAGRNVRHIHLDPVTNTFDTHIDVTGLPSGIYILSVDVDGTHFHQRVTLQ